MINAILLAAGSARRFGGAHKLLATIPGNGARATVVRVAAERLLASGAIAELIVVLGRDAERVQGELEGLGYPVHFVHNADYDAGMSSSLGAGVRAAHRYGAALDGAMVALADQPEVRADVARLLVEAFFGLPPSSRSAAIVVPRYQREAGHPVLFGAHVLPELMAVTGDRGGKAVVERDVERVHHVDFDFAAPPDIDTPEDLRALRERQPGLRANE